MINLELLISRSLSLPRRVTSDMRASLRANPTKAIRYTQLVDHLSNAMRKGYAIGFRKRGRSLSRESMRAKEAEYKVQARNALKGYEASSNPELKRIYRQARSSGSTILQATNLVLRRFRTLGVTPPATNRMKALYNSAIRSAYHEGIWDADRLDAAVWGFKFLTMGDERVRHPTHSQYHGVTLPKEHPFWTEVFPPIDWNCRCRIKTYKRKQKIVRPPGNPVRIDSGFIGQGFELR